MLASCFAALACAPLPASASASASAEAATGGRRILYADRLGAVRFGVSEAVAIREVSKLIDATPLRRKPTTDYACNTDASIRWHDLAISFDHGRFVGYSYTGRRFETAAGFRVGDRLGRGRALYGAGFVWSAENGGSWWVKTPAGLIGGWAWRWNSPPPIGALATANSIAAGAVGCPAMSPGPV